MIKKNILLISLFIIIINLSCKKTYDTDGKSIVINEVMPVNSTVVADQNGQYDDWIELFNLTSTKIDITGYYLSDSKNNPKKWKFPSGTYIEGNEYLIIWADKDTTQAGLHTNFSLSSLGEKVIFSNSDGSQIDKVEYPAQTLELSYSRFPDGTGFFRWQNPSFNITNGSSK